MAFLELRRLSWDSPASLLEKLIKYEAVHDIRSWADLKNRLDSDRQGQLTILGEAPLAELADYQNRLNAMTAGQGSYTLALSHYEAVPPAVQQQLVGQYKVQEE